MHDPERIRRAFSTCWGPAMQSDSNPGGPELMESRPHISSSDKSPPGLL